MIELVAWGIVGLVIGWKLRGYSRRLCQLEAAMEMLLATDEKP